MFETLRLNFAATKLRYEMLEGRQYLVVPGVMITEGVHDGSNGPLLYSEAELSKTPVVWNHKPVIFYHPTDAQGNSVSACDAAIIETRGVGLIMNTQWDATETLKKLRFEAWIDESKLNKLDPRVLEAVKSGKVVEVSTGLFTDNENVKGTFNGKEYTAIAKNYRPDHLAILFDRKGACSVADGAGLLANEATTANQEFSAKERKRLARKGSAMKDGSYPIESEQDLHNAVQAIGRAKNPAQAKKHIISRAKSLGKTDILPEHWKLTSNAAEGFHQVHEKLMQCLSTKHGKPGERWNGYIEDVHPNQVIYGNEGELFSHAYSVNGEDVVTLTGDPKKVKRVNSYHPVDHRTIDSTDGISDGYGTTGIIPDEMQVINKEKEKMKTREERVGDMVTRGVNEARRKALMEMDESTFTTFEEMLAEAEPTNPALKNIMATGGGSPVPGAATPNVPGFNQGGQPMTMEQYLAMMPPQMANMVRNAMAAEQSEKERLIGVITANANNRFSKEYLQTQGLEVLVGIANLAAPSQAQQQPAVLNGLRPNYLGAAGAVPAVPVPVEGLKTPVINWKE